MTLQHGGWRMDGMRTVPVAGVGGVTEGWDFGDNTVIARNPRFTLLWQRGDSAAVLLTYERIGYMFPGPGRDTLGYKSAPGIDSIRMPVIRTKAGWRVGYVGWIKHWSPAALIRKEDASTPRWFR